MQLIPVKATLVGVSSFNQTNSKNAPQPTASISPSQSIPVPLKDVKTEPLDEEIATAMANITEESKSLKPYYSYVLLVLEPLNLDLLLKQSPPSGPTSSSGGFVSEHDEFENTSSDLFDRGLCSSVRSDVQNRLKTKDFQNGPQALKRTRKPTRRDEYVYNLPEEEHLPEEEVDEVLDEPVAKNPRVIEQPEGCRCEYIVPDLEKRMDRMMETIRRIETLATTIGTRVEQR